MLEHTIAGYRLVRKIGSGSRADVYLGHAGEESARTAAIKVFRSDVSQDSVAAEVGALMAASHAHVVQLRDLSSSHGAQPVLVLERLELGSLAQLLTSRGELGAGEAVTILAPLCAAVEVLRDAGVAHSAIAASRVLFRESGAPVLCGFGYASVGRASDIDLRALAELAGVVLERVRGADALREWLASRAAYPPTFSTELSQRLFELAEAAPVRFTPDTPAIEIVPSRALRDEPVVELVETEPTRVSRLLGLVQPYIERIPDRLRKPRYLAIAVAAVTLLTAMAVVPSGGSPTTAVTPTAEAAAQPAGPVFDDDPVAAFEQLASVRNECIRDLSILCLDSVLQPGSAAMEHDVALIRSIERGDGGAADLSPRNPELVERMGDAALLRFETGSDSEPASVLVENVLLVKGEAGWRIRSYVAN